MCFGGSSKSTKPPAPTTPARFDYGVSQPSDQQRKVAIATSVAPEAQNTTLGSELGSSAPKAY